MELDDAAALVTGGASGLGLATARRLLDGGARHVVLADLPSSPGEQVAADLGDRASFVPTDVTSAEQVAAAVEAAAGAGALRVLVNCAGVGDPARTLSRGTPLDLERFTRVITINLVGTFNAIRLAAAAMAATEPVGEERGVIVNTASAAAFDGQIGQASYAASKAGIAGMTLPVARDLASSLVRVVTIAPGLFDTPILAGLSDEARVSIASQVPHPTRLGRPDEFARLVEQVVANPMLNGETIRLDGAIRMGPR